MSEVRKYSWPLSLSHWKCRCLGVKKKKKWAENICYSYLLLDLGFFDICISFSLYVVYIFYFSIINISINSTFKSTGSTKAMNETTDYIQ